MTGGNPLPLSAALHAHPQGATVVTSASGRMFRVEMAAPALIERLACAGSPAAGGDGDDAEFVTVIEALRRDGCLGADPRAAEWLRFGAGEVDTTAAARTSLLVTGDDSLVDALLHLLQGGLGDRFAGATRCEEPSLDAVLGASAPAPPLVIVLCDRFDFARLTGVDDVCSARGARWIPLHLDAGRGWLGPAIQSGATPCCRDVLARRLAAVPGVDLFHALTTPPLYGGPQPPSGAELLWMLSILVAEVERWVAGVQPLCWWSEVELDPLTFAVTPHPVLPLPGRAVAGPPARSDMEVFVDERTGIVNRLDPLQAHPSLPSSLRIVQSVACDMTRISACANGRSNHGSSFVSEEVARAAAIAECIERYCGNWVDPARLVEASHRELVARGEHAVDPDRLVLHSEAQYAAAGFPLVPFTRDLRVRWVRGECLTCDRPAWVPASLVHVNWNVGEYAEDPPTNYAMFAGIAAGASWDAALASGLEEVIERDATMIWWLNAHRLPGVRPTPRLEAVWAGRPTELGQRAWLIHLDNEFDVPVMAGVVENLDEGLLAIGFAARPDPEEAGLKAWAEALALQESSRWMQDATGPFWSADELVDLKSLKPPREDRRYLESYRADFHDVHTLMGQLQVFLDPRARDLVRPWVDVDPVRELRALPRLPDRRSATYRERLERRGFEVFAVDLTTPDVATTNLRVARVVVPGLVPNLPAAFPPFGGRRVRDAAVELGWRDRALEEAELNLLPLPHA